MKLVQPSVEYKTSFIEAVQEYKANPDDTTKSYRDLDLNNLENDFNSFISREISHSRGENLPKGFVPQTDFWLVDGQKYIGHTGIRHILNDHLLRIGGNIGYNIRPSMRRQGYGKKILELALIEAKKLGIDRALLTCDVTNVPSAKIIEANGGVLENKVPNPETGIEKLRYWIAIK